MNKLTPIQRSLIQNYGKYAPRFTVIGEQYHDPVVELIDYPVTYRGGARLEVERVRVFRIDRNGRCWTTVKYDQIAGADPADQAFLNDYTKELI